MDCDDVAVLYTKIMADDTVNSGTSIIKIIISEYDENGVLPLLALDQDCVATEKLQRFHSIVGEGDNRIVIICCICDYQGVWLLLLSENRG